MPNEDKPDPWPGTWEYRVALSLCWLVLTMYVDSWDAFVYIRMCVVHFDQTAACMHYKSVTIR